MTRYRGLLKDTLAHVQEGAANAAFISRRELERHAAALAKLMLIFLALYFSELGIFPLSIDEEFGAYRKDAAGWVAQGRWAAYLLEDILFPQPTVPYLPVLIFGLSVVIAYIILLRAHGDELTLCQYLLFPLFAAFPSWFFIIEFYTNLPAIALGVISSSVSIYFFALSSAAFESRDLRLAEQGWRLMGAVAAGAIAIGCYQSFLFFIVSAGGGVVLTRILGYGNAHLVTWRTFAILSAIVVGASISYYLIWKAFLLVLGVPVLYIQGLIDFNSLLQNPVRILNRSLLEVYKVYTGSADVYGQKSGTIGALTVLFILFSLVKLQQRGWSILALGTFLIAGIFLAPFALNPLSGGIAAYRSMVALPYVIWLCGAVLVNCGTRLIRLPGIVLVGFVVFESLYTLSLFQAANHLVRDHDRLLAQQVYTRVVAAHSRFSRDWKYTVEFYGAKPFETPYPRILSSTVGQSFFEWDQGNPSRILTFMKLLGYNNLEVLSPSRRSEFIADFNTMPIWPAEGSVKVVGDVTLVRLGDKPGLVHQNIAIPFLATGENVLFRARAQELNSKIAVNNAKFIPDEAGMVLRTSRDTQLLIPLVESSAQSCRTIQVTIAQETSAGSTLQVFYRRVGEPAFSEPSSTSVYKPRGRQETTVFIQSDQGFEPTLRLDPVANSQRIKVESVAVGCVQRL